MIVAVAVAATTRDPDKTSAEGTAKEGTAVEDMAGEATAVTSKVAADMEAVEVDMEVDTREVATAVAVAEEGTRKLLRVMTRIATLPRWQRLVLSCYEHRLYVSLEITCDSQISVDRKAYVHMLAFGHITRRSSQRYMFAQGECGAVQHWRDELCVA